MRTFLLFTFFPFFCWATELAPWFERDLEFHPRVSYLVHSYSSNVDHFVDIGVGGAYTPWAAEIEVVLAATRENEGYDQTRLTGRYQWMNDVIGDFFSLVTGVTLIHASTDALHDFGSMHHGEYEGEVHLALGRESVCMEFWTSRWWSLFSYGLANHGSPWMRANFHWEKNWWDVHRFRFFMHTLFGFGNHDLSDNFQGFGPIRHYSVNLGMGYRILLCEWGDLDFEYTYQPYEKNFQQQAHRAVLTYHFPFGI